MTNELDRPLSQADVDELDRAAKARAGIPRPTPAPFAWADPFLTVGITGTNGKTSTTFLAAHAMRGDRPVLCESTIGYRLDDDVLDIPATDAGFYAAFQTAARAGGRYAAVEVTSEALARGYAKRWRFDIGVFTNLSPDHFAAHGSWEHYLASKAQLFLHLAPGRTAVLNACDSSALLIDRVTPPDVLRSWYAVPSRGPLLHPADLAARNVDVSADGTRIELEPSPMADSLGGFVETRLVGRVFAENALAAASAVLAAGFSGQDVCRGIAACPVMPGRFEIVARSPIVAVDFAHTPDALARVCDTARELAGRARVIVVFGAGGERDKQKREPMGREVGSRADVAIVTTDNPRSENPADIAKLVTRGCRRGGRAYVRVEPDRRNAIEQAIAEARPGDVVLVAGKGHEREQIIGKERLPFSDVDEVRKHLPPG